MKKLLLACVVLLISVTAVTAQNGSRKSPNTTNTTKAKVFTPTEVKAHNDFIRKQKQAAAATKNNTTISKATPNVADKPKKAN